MVLLPDYPEKVILAHRLRVERLALLCTLVLIGGGGWWLAPAVTGGAEMLPRVGPVLVLFASALLWLMVGRRTEAQIQRPLERLARKGIEFHQDVIQEIDLDGRQVRTGSETFDFDHLVVSLGAQLVPEMVEGFDAMALNLYELEGCKRIHAALETFTGGTLGVLVSSFPFKCPAAPYEAAMLAEAFLRKKGVRDRTEIHVYTPEHQPMPMAGPEFGNAIAGMLEARGIHLHLLYTFEKLLPATREIKSSGGAPEKVDLLIGVPPHLAPEVVRSSGLLGVAGWIDVDKNTLRTEHDGVYAIGDIANIRLPNGKTLPMAGVFAHYQAKVVAEQIAAEINGRPARSSFDGRGSCWLEIGDGKAGYASGDFYHAPEPALRMRRPGRLWHLGKVAFEKWWLNHWF